MGFEWIISEGCLINELISKGCPMFFKYLRVVQCVLISKGCSMNLIEGLPNVLDRKFVQ